MPQEGSGLNRSVRSAPLSLAANRATRATTELTAFPLAPSGPVNRQAFDLGGDNSMCGKAQGALSG